MFYLTIVFSYILIYNYDLQKHYFVSFFHVAEMSFQACVVLLYVAIVMLGVLVGLVDKLLVM